MATPAPAAPGAYLLPQPAPAPAPAAPAPYGYLAPVTTPPWGTVNGINPITGQPM